MKRKEIYTVSLETEKINIVVNESKKPYKYFGKTLVHIKRYNFDLGYFWLTVSRLNSLKKGKYITLYDNDKADLNWHGLKNRKRYD